jgi:hypothetical protein
VETGRNHRRTEKRGPVTVFLYYRRRGLGIEGREGFNRGVIRKG